MHMIGGDNPTAIERDDYERMRQQQQAAIDQDRAAREAANDAMRQHDRDLAQQGQHDRDRHDTGFWGR